MSQEPIKAADAQEIITALRGALSGNPDIKDQRLNIPMRPELLYTAQEVVAALANKHINVISNNEANNGLQVFFTKNGAAEGIKMLAENLAKFSVDEIVTGMNLKREYNARLSACVDDKIGEGEHTLKQYNKAMSACELPVRTAFLKDLEQRDKTGTAR